MSKEVIAFKITTIITIIKMKSKSYKIICIMKIKTIIAVATPMLVRRKASISSVDQVG